MTDHIDAAGPPVEPPQHRGRDDARKTSLLSDGPTGSNSPPDETESAALPDPRPSARLLTIIIVFTTLSVATVGYLANRASTNAGRTSGQAGQLGLAASRDLESEHQQARSDYFAYVQSEADLHRVTQAFWQSGGTSNYDWNDLRIAWQALADQTTRAVPEDLGANSPTGPILDPSFPNRFFTVRTLQSTAERARI